MMNILILGAHGKIAQLARKELLPNDVHLTLFLRNAKRLQVEDPRKETIIEGDVTDLALLEQALAGQDVVYANLAGKNIVEQAETLVAAMKKVGIKRLIWISTLGIYDEVPGAFGRWNHEMLDDGYLPTYTKAAAIIEDSGLDYTIIRPAWLSDKDEIDYETTEKGEPFKGTEVSRKSVANLVKELALNPQKAIGASLGVDKPNTEGNKPAWFNK